MTQAESEQRVERLEMLFSEQEYTIEALNKIVTRQSEQLAALTEQVDYLKNQFRDLNRRLPDDAISDEKPPHY